VIIAGDSVKVGKDDAVIVPAGVRHNVINTGQKPMKLFMIYGPPHDPRLSPASTIKATAKPPSQRATARRKTIRSGFIVAWRDPSSTIASGRATASGRSRSTR